MVLLLRLVILHEIKSVDPLPFFLQMNHLSNLNILNLYAVDFI